MARFWYFAQYEQMYTDCTHNVVYGTCRWCLVMEAPVIIIIIILYTPTSYVVHMQVGYSVSIRMVIPYTQSNHAQQPPKSPSPRRNLMIIIK